MRKLYSYIDSKKIIANKKNCFLIFLFSTFFAFSQHPNREKIHSLQKLLQGAEGKQKVDVLNAISEEYWSPPRVFPDSISCWANVALKEAYQNNNRLGAAKAIMHLGVSDIYRKKFVSAEHYLLQAIQMFENKGSDADIGWCNLWLGQTLYSQTRFTEAITRYRTSLPYLDKLRDAEGEGKAWAWMGFIYAAKGNYDSSFEYCSKSLLIRQKMGDGVCVAAALTNMGHLYRVAGAYNDALDYYRQGLQYAITNSIDIVGARWNYLDEPLAVIYKLMNRPDSSLYYLQKALRIDPENQMTHISLGEVLLTKKQYDSALAIFLNPVERFRRENNRWDLMRVLLDVAKAYEGKMNYTVALQYAKEALSIADAGDVKQYVVDAYALLSKIYDGLHNKNSAYLYLQRFTALKDSMMNNQLLWRLSNYKKQADFKKQLDHIALLDKDNKIKEEKLKRESLLKWILMVFLLIGGGSGVMLYKTLSLRRKNEQLEGKHKQSQLQQHVTELEMQALRAQMNPHFIFNCLNSINRFILKNETEAASDYLTKFSRLIRMVLTNSMHTVTSLEDELEMLRLYLDMERLRFKNAFDYSITFNNSIDIGNTFVPPLLLQPFAENAIWHGLMHKEGQGHLKIELTIDNDELVCTITDNGIGRAKAAEYKSKAAYKQKSMGLQITTDRLALLNETDSKQTFFDIEDIMDDKGNAAGTKVILKMNYRKAQIASEI